MAVEIEILMSLLKIVAGAYLLFQLGCEIGFD